MPAAFIITTSAAGVDAWNGGQLIEDSGIITDLDGGFDVATLAVFYREGASPPALRSVHPEYENLYLFGISPRRLAGNSLQVTLNYKGLAGRDLFAGTVPGEGDLNAKFSYGIRLTEKQWPKGELTGTVGGNNLADYAVNVMQPQQTVRISWMAKSRISSSIFNFTSGGRSSAQLGPIDEGFYSYLANPVLNFPRGWVPIDASSDQAYPGINIWANSITYVGIPEFSAG